MDSKLRNQLIILGASIAALAIEAAISRTHDVVLSMFALLLLSAFVTYNIYLLIKLVVQQQSSDAKIS